MSHRHSKRVPFSDQLNDGKQAVQMLELIGLILDESTGLENLLNFFEAVVKSQYPRHKKLQSLIHKLSSRQRFLLKDIVAMQYEYRRFIEKYQHDNGEVIAPSLQSILNYSISLESLLEHYPIDRVVEDFLDG